jgi:hypothetical protein
VTEIKQAPETNIAWIIEQLEYIGEGVPAGSYCGFLSQHDECYLSTLDGRIFARFPQFDQNGGKLNPWDTADHLRVFDPENTRTLLDYIRDLERERDEARAAALEEARVIVDHAMPADPSDGDADSVRICERIMDEIEALKDRAP